MNALEIYAAQARYNRWMNDKVYGVSALLTGQERRRDLGAFFKSVHGTLNHLLLADRIWLARFGAMPAPAFKSLSQELYDDFETLRAERRKTDDVLDAFVAGLTEAKLAAPITYTRSGGEVRHPLWYGVTHLFNHQTHHRGQVTTLLVQLGRDPGVTDMIALLRGDVPQKLL